MMGTMNCVYETPCGWCSKWDKKCDRKMLEKVNTVDKDIEKAKDAAKVVEKCKSECDHEWECTGIGTAGTTYMCKKCYTSKIYPAEYNDKISVTI